MEVIPTVISYNDIVNNKDLSSEVSSAFGPDSLGLVAIKDIPDFLESRVAALKAIRKFADLPEEVREKYSHPQSSYSFGWSHGKERMRNGVPDKAKGSYYANPIKDVITEDEELKALFPEIYCDNIWPRDHLPELEPAFKALSRAQLDVGYKMSQLFDSYLYGVTNGEHKKDTIFGMLNKCTTFKARLLHYFAIEPEASKKDDGLCGWHLDHGGITTLVCPMYLDEQGEEIPPPEDCGLHVKHSTSGRVIKVTVPSDHMIVQLGESLQYYSGGFLRAAAHCVKSSKTPNITRETMALFMDWHPDETFVLPHYSLPFQDVVTTPNLPEGVPELEGRVEGAKCYRDFAVKTFRAYYNES